MPDGSENIVSSAKIQQCLRKHHFGIPGWAVLHNTRNEDHDPTLQNTLGFTDNNTLCSAALHSTDSVLRAKHRKQGSLDTTSTVSSSVNHENKYVTIHHLPYPSQPTLYAPPPLSIAAYTISPLPPAGSQLQIGVKESPQGVP